YCTNLYTYSFPTRRSSDLEKMYHMINLSSTLFTFYVIVILGDLISQTMNSIVSSGFIFIIIYFLNIKRRERLIERLAVEINEGLDRKSTRLNSSHVSISYA